MDTGIQIVVIIKVFKVKLCGDGDNGDKRCHNKREKEKKHFKRLR